MAWKVTALDSLFFSAQNRVFKNVLAPKPASLNAPVWERVLCSQGLAEPFPVGINARPHIHISRLQFIKQQ